MSKYRTIQTFEMSENYPFSEHCKECQEALSLAKALRAPFILTSRMLGQVDYHAIGPTFKRVEAVTILAYQEPSEMPLIDELADMVEEYAELNKGA